MWVLGLGITPTTTLRVFWHSEVNNGTEQVHDSSDTLVPQDIRTVSVCTL